MKTITSGLSLLSSSSGPSGGTSDSYEFLSESADGTRALASLLAGCCRGGELLSLHGPLGAGKSEFVRGFAAHFGITRGVVSPTFVLEAIYSVPAQQPGTIRDIHHWDLYRLSTEAGENEILDQVGDPSGVVLVEWAERVSWLEGRGGASITIEFVGTDTGRRIYLAGIADDAFRSRLQNALSSL